MPLLLVEGPTQAAVSLEEAKLHLRVDDDEEDALIAGQLVRAHMACEDFQGRAYGRRTYELSLHSWPGRREIRLPMPPLVEVESIKYVTADSAEHTLDPASYLVDARSEPGRIVLRNGYAWPQEQLREANGVVIRYVAGYEHIPAHLQTFGAAVLLTLGHLYEHRENVLVVRTATVAPIPRGAQSLLYPHRVFGVVDIK